MSDWIKQVESHLVLNPLKIAPSDILESLSKPDHVSILTGSQVAGTASSVSDLDVRVFCCPSLNHPFIEGAFYQQDLWSYGLTEMRSMGPIMVHTIYWPMDVIEVLLNKLEAATPPHFVPVIADTQWELIEELRLVAVVTGNALLESINARIDYEKIVQIRNHMLMNEYDQLCGETVTRWRNRQSVPASLRARKLLDKMVDVILSYNGELISKDKWR